MILIYIFMKIRPVCINMHSNILSLTLFFLLFFPTLIHQNSSRETGEMQRRAGKGNGFHREEVEVGSGGRKGACALE